MGDPEALPLPVCWVDGRLAPLDAPAVRADDSAFSEGRGCYTSARVEDGRVRFAERHTRRLERDARALGLAPVDRGRVRRALDELARAAFPRGAGVVRIQVSRDASGAQHLVGVPRALGASSPEWSAITAPLPHEGPLVAGGPKLSQRLLHALAADAAREADVDEALMLDRAGRLVEGARSNLLVVDARGRLVSPPLERGAVAGVAREVLSEGLGGLPERDVSRRALAAAREIIAINAVRGARAITRLDGKPVGEGRPGPWQARLDAILEQDDDAPRVAAGSSR